MNAAVHNFAVRALIRSAHRMIGPDPAALLVCAESFVVGLFLLIVKLGGDEPVLEAFTDGVRRRLSEVRLVDLPPAGRA